MMSEPERARVVAFLRRELRAIKPHLPADWPTAALYHDDLDLDSLDLVELVARIEQRYAIFIPDADLVGFVSLDATVDYVSAHVPS